MVDVGQLFEAEFLQLWDEHGHKGDAYPAHLFGSSVPQGRKACKVLTEISAQAAEYSSRGVSETLASRHSL